MGEVGAGVGSGLMGALDKLDCSDEERALVLVMALLTRARRGRARAGSLVKATGGGRAVRLRRAAGAALALAEAEDAMGVAADVCRALGASSGQRR